MRTWEQFYEIAKDGEEKSIADQIQAKERELGRVAARVIPLAPDESLAREALVLFVDDQEPEHPDQLEKILDKVSFRIEEQLVRLTGAMSPWGAVG